MVSQVIGNRRGSYSLLGIPSFVRIKHRKGSRQLAQVLDRLVFLDLQVDRFPPLGNRFMNRKAQEFFVEPGKGIESSYRREDR